MNQTELDRGVGPPKATARPWLNLPKTSHPLVRLPSLDVSRPELFWGRTASGEEYGDRVRGCLLPPDGEQLEWLAPGILAVPWWRVV